MKKVLKLVSSFWYVFIWKSKRSISFWHLFPCLLPFYLSQAYLLCRWAFPILSQHILLTGLYFLLDFQSWYSFSFVFYHFSVQLTSACIHTFSKWGHLCLDSHYFYWFTFNSSFKHVLLACRNYFVYIWSYCSDSAAELLFTPFVLRSLSSFW